MSEYGVCVELSRWSLSLYVKGGEGEAVSEHDELHVAQPHPTSSPHQARRVLLDSKLHLIHAQSS